MKFLLVYSVTVLVAIPFGAIPGILAGILVSMFAYCETKNLLVLTSIALSFLGVIYLPLAALSLIPIYLYSGDEKFVQFTTLISAIAVSFILFPVIYLFIRAPPWGFPEGMITTLFTSIIAATAATLIGLFLAIPLGYLLARKDFPGKEAMSGIIDIPIVIPHTVAGIILLLVFGTSGIIGAPLESIGLKFYYAMPGIIIAMLFVSIPFLINQVREGIEKVDERYELVAMNLGASRVRAFFTVLLPLIKRSVLSGSINAWARAMSEFGAVIMIAFYPMIAPTYIYFLFTNYGLNATLPATSFLLMVTLLIFVILRSAFGRVKYAGD